MQDNEKMIVLFFYAIWSFYLINSIYIIMDNLISGLIKYFKKDFGALLEAMDSKFIALIEEIRIRANLPIVFHTSDDAYFLTNAGKKTKNADDGIIFSATDLEDLVNAFCNHSIYAYDKDIMRGFITIGGGIRVGICGKGVYTNKSLFSMRDFHAINIRIPRQIVGISKMILPYIYSDGVFQNTFIISPPNLGKTTLLRDAIRAISDGDYEKRLKTCVVDERSEIAGDKGTTRFNLGAFTDVMEGIDKETAIMMALRTLSPHVIACDEMGDKSDLDAIHEIINCGVKIIATAHADTISRLGHRLFFKEIIEEGMIERFVFLSDSLGKGTVKYILDSDLKSVTHKPFLLKV